MPLSKKAQEVLVEATRLISIKSRWIKGAYHDTKMEGFQRVETYCALGAISNAGLKLATEHYDNEYAYEGANEVRDILSRRLAATGKGSSIPSFNDRRSTTYEDVKKLFCDTVKAEVEGGDDGTE